VAEGPAAAAASSWMLRSSNCSFASCDCSALTCAVRDEVEAEADEEGADTESDARRTGVVVPDAPREWERDRLVRGRGVTLPEAAEPPPTRAE